MRSSAPFADDCAAADPRRGSRADTGEDRPHSDSRGPSLRLGRYELIAKIAEGGMASVFAARVAGTEQTTELVAIKMIRDEFASSGEFVTMFMDEARIVSRLSHPNIVCCHEFGNDVGHLFIAMEFLSGQSLWAVWEACRAGGTRLGFETIAWLGARVADGLHYAHELEDEGGSKLEIVHRDVNATNIFVTYEGEIKIIDFGLAKAANRASKTSGRIIKGKVAYMSPEQVVGAHVDRRTDIFALGATLWELGCDRRLFKHADQAETLRRVHAAEVPDPTHIVDGFPRELWRVLRRALARDRGRRYDTAAEFARELDAFARSGGTRADPSALARTMRDLFTRELARPTPWSAGGPGAADRAAVDVRGVEEVDLACSTSSALAEATRAAPSDGFRQPKGVRNMIAAAVVVAVVVASVVLFR
ncbi:MAG: serine/threonine-protein kinase [Polyangiaceae bacterium]